MEDILKVGNVKETYALAIRDGEGGYYICTDTQGNEIRANTLAEIRELKDEALDNNEPPIFVIKESTEVVEEI